LLSHQIEALGSNWVISINQVVAPVAGGCAVSCGALLVVAGTSKLYRGIRGLNEMTAVRRALRMPHLEWKLFALAAGAAEGATGALVCSGAYPVAGGASLAALGAVFCALLIYVRIRRTPGGCGCVSWRTARVTPAGAITWRSLARSGMVLGTGVAYALVSTGASGVPRQYWFGGGVIAGSVILVLLSMPEPVRTRPCRRWPWRTTRTALRDLAGHETFAMMASSAGPFGPTAWHRRNGCTDEFWFTPLALQDGRAIVFQVHRAAPRARLAVHASLRTPLTPGADWPARAINVADGPAEMQRAAAASEGPRSRTPSAEAAGWVPAREDRTLTSVLVAGAAPTQSSRPSARRRETS
jgi:hypothetical protein